VAYINSGLSDQTDVSLAARLSINENYCYTGQYPRYNEGFVVSMAEGKSLLDADPKNRDVVRLFAGGDELLVSGKAARWVIDFQLRSIVDAQAYKKPFEHVRNLVLPYVQELARREREVTGKSVGQDQGWLNTWWQHFRPRAELISKIEQSARFLACSRVTKRPLFMFVSSEVRPSDALTCFPLDDDYSFGVLQSKPHYLWFHAKCSNMKSDPRYTSESVFQTFPWPQTPTRSQIESIAAAATALRLIRSNATVNAAGGIRALYASLDLPGKSPLKDAHAALDAAVFAAYDITAKKDVLKQLLELNSSVASAIAAGRAVARPGIPTSYEDAPSLVTKDSLGA